MMSTKQQIVCDGPRCSAVRGEGNKWLSMNHDPATGAPLIFALCVTSPMHLCSNECAHAVLDAHLDILRQEANATHQPTAE